MSIHRSQVPNELLDSAIRWESLRSEMFRNLGRQDQADECAGLAQIYTARLADLLEEHISNV